MTIEAFPNAKGFENEEPALPPDGIGFDHYCDHCVWKSSCFLVLSALLSACSGLFLAIGEGLYCTLSFVY
jgi:hypothetical protein